MTDSKISKKHQPSAFLAWRILTVSVLLLVIPLILQTLFLYKQEYEEKLNDVSSNLQDLALERALLIEQMIESDWKILDILEIKTHYKTSSNKGYVGAALLENIPLPQGARERFVVVSKARGELLVGNQISETNAAVIAIPFSNIIHNLGATYPARVALIDAKGKTLCENMKIQADDLIRIKSAIVGTDLTLEISIDADHIRGLHRQSYYLRFATLLLFVGVIGGGAVYLLTRRIAKPLMNLSRTMGRVSDGAAHARYTPDRMGFEINDLGKQFNETVDALQRNAQEAERYRVSRERLAEELRIGHDIQANLLPKQVPGLAELEIATASLSAKEVNGDYYDLFPLGNGGLLIVMCDMAGKGISACLFCLGLRSMIRSFASVAPDVAEIVKMTNDLFWLDARESSMFATVWIGIYDPIKRNLTYCSQGHPPALLKRDGKLKELWTGGIALGAQKLDSISTKEIALMKGDLIALYTDGILEAHNSDRELFGKERLEKFLLRDKSENSQQIADHLIEEIHLFSRGSPQHDDMALIVLSVI